MNFAALTDAHKGDLSFLVRDANHAAKITKRIIAGEARTLCFHTLDSIHIARRNGNHARTISSIEYWRLKEAMAVKEFKDLYATYRKHWGTK